MPFSSEPENLFYKCMCCGWHSTQPPSLVKVRVYERNEAGQLYFKTLDARWCSGCIDDATIRSDRFTSEDLDIPTVAAGPTATMSWSDEYGTKVVPLPGGVDLVPK